MTQIARARCSAAAAGPTLIEMFSMPGANQSTRSFIVAWRASIGRSWPEAGVRILNGQRCNGRAVRQPGALRSVRELGRKQARKGKGKEGMMGEGGRKLSAALSVVQPGGAREQAGSSWAFGLTWAGGDGRRGAVSDLQNRRVLRIILVVCARDGREGPFLGQR